jgi:hypothetical protein
MQMYTGTIEDELHDACKRLGYGMDINNLRGRVTVNIGSGKKKDDHVFKNATLALMWVEARERAIRSIGR